MGLFRKLACWVTHRSYWAFYGYGDWRVQYCRKCHDKWVVPFEVARGPRIEPQPNHAPASTPPPPGKP